MDLDLPDEPIDEAARAGSPQEQKQEELAKQWAQPEITKHLPAGGMGPGGRPLVLTDKEAGARPPRSTDETLPRCPRCSHDSLAVLCPVVRKAEMIRYYRCPTCDYSAKIMVGQVADRMRRSYVVPDSADPEPVEKQQQSAVKRPEI